MIRTGKVIQTQGDTLTVCFSRLESCESCGMCGSGRSDAMITLKGQAQPGDFVEVEMPDAQVLKVSAITYLLPLIGLLFGLLLGTILFKRQEIAVLFTGLTFLALCLIGLKMIDKSLGIRKNWQPRILAVNSSDPSEQPVSGQ